MKCLRGIPDIEDVAYIVTRFGDPVAAEPCPYGRNGEINPHVTRFFFKNGHAISIFHQKPVYYEALNGTWRPLREVTSYHGDTRIDLISDWDKKMSLGFLRWLMRRQEIRGGQVRIPWQAWKKKMLPLREMETILFTTSTFYPDPAPGTTTKDCRNEKNNSNNYTDTITASSSNTGENSASTVSHENRQGNGFGSTFYSNTRGIFTFNTASIPDEDVISGVTFSLYGVALNLVGSSTDKGLYVLSLTSTTSETAYSASDYGNKGSTLFGSITSALSGSSVYNDIVFNGDGIASVSKTGISRYIVLGWYDYNETAPINGVTGFYINMSHADTGGTAQDPKLTVEHGVSLPNSPKPTVGGGVAAGGALMF